MLSDPVCVAVELGNYDLVNALLLEGCDPTLGKNYALSIAAYLGNVNILKLLMSHEKVNANANNCNALRCAAVEEHAEVVDLLLPLSNPAENDNYMIKWAAEYGKVDMFWTYLKDKRFNPETDTKNEILYAVFNAQKSTKGHSAEWYFLPKSALISPHPLVSHFRIVVVYVFVRNHSSASLINWIASLVASHSVNVVFAFLFLTQHIAVFESLYKGTSNPSRLRNLSPSTSARNSPMLLVPCIGPNRKISWVSSLVNTPLYSIGPGLPLQAASTLILSKMGFSVEVLGLRLGLLLGSV